MDSEARSDLRQDNWKALNGISYDRETPSVDGWAYCLQHFSGLRMVFDLQKRPLSNTMLGYVVRGMYGVWCVKLVKAFAFLQCPVS